MNHLSIHSPRQTFQPDSWSLSGEGITRSERRIRDLAGVFADEWAYQALDSELTVYSVQAHLPLKEGTPGGLFIGTTTVQPGKVGQEYFMTRGHFHATSDRAEYYWCLKGYGMLILMNQQRHTWAEEMFPGSLHFIAGNIAHRTANTGIAPLVFGACWPSDAGHNYHEIDKNGFSARLLESDGKPRLVAF